MKKIMICIAVSVLVVTALLLKPGKSVAQPVAEKKILSAEQFQPVAVLELFTSQGCSSCPSADRLLGRTITKAKKDGKNIFALSFHVDYWNRLGWTDPFSAKEYSERQNEYASKLRLNSVYTPQMIVNGAREFVGSDESGLNEAVGKSLGVNAIAAFKTITATLQNSEAPQVQFSLQGNYAGCNINFALVSLSETTSIKRGENGGLTLTNENVVRQFVTVPASAEGTVSFKSSPIPAGNNMTIVAYIQNNRDLKIIGAAKAEIK